MTTTQTTPENTQTDIDRARAWYDSIHPATPETCTPHPLATLAAVIDTAARTGVDSGTLAGHLLAECSDDVRGMFYLSTLFVHRAWNDAAEALRHAHTWFHAGQTVGDDDVSLRNVPDGYTRVQSSTVQRRSNTGTSYREVIVHGRSYVGGDTAATPNRGATMSAAHIAHALDTAPRTAMGHVDGMSISRLVDVIYPDLPRLSGADTVAWADFQAWDQVRAATPRKGLKPRLSVPAVPAGAYNAARGERVELITYRTDTTVFVGHRVAERIATVRAQRAQRARTVTEAFTVSTIDDVVSLIAVIGDEPGRYTWTVGERSGTITVSATGRISASGSGIRVAACKSIGAAQRALAAQVAAL